MKLQHLWRVLYVPALTLSVLGSACAAPLSLNNVTAADAAAQIGARYGVEVTFGGHVARYATFTIDADDAGNGCLAAVNALSNAVGADFNKTYVLAGTSGENVVSPQVDTTEMLPVSQTTFSVADALAMVAGLDDATVQGADALTGTVTLSSSSLTIAQAAQEIAAQTHSRWRTVYVLTPRTRGRVLGGTIVGRTNGGSLIIEMAAVYYHDARWQARQQRFADDAKRQAQADQQAAAQQQAQQQQALAYAQAAGQAAQQAAMSNLYGSGTSQNGYNPYANTYQNSNNGAYDNGAYDNGAYDNGAYDNGSGLVINGGSGSAYGTGGYSYGNAPTYFGNGNY